MTLRGFTAFGLAAFMLHLNVVRADKACATHEMREAAPEMPHDMAAMPANHGGHAANVVDVSNCETPVQEDCCQAMTSCGASFGAGVQRDVATIATIHEHVSSAVPTRPLSRNITPEPPPPRL